MKIYKILFCSIGSIARRHIANVREYCRQRDIGCEIDAVRSKVSNDNDGLGLRKVFSYDDEITEVYDAVFITNPTFLHFDTIKRYAGIARNMFIEKPVFSQTNANIGDLNLNGNANYYVACPLRYNKVLQYIKSNIDLSDTFSVRSISSSYLPDWRPGTDYRKTYSAHRDLGGGVSIDLIHEWDYLTWLFGMPQKSVSVIDKISNLEIDSDDIAIYIARNGKVTFELHLDYFGRDTIREMQIFQANETIVADILHGRISFLKSKQTIELEEDRNGGHFREIEHFFDIIDGRCPNDNDIRNALDVLKLTK